jgi:hypothetical protein
MSCYARKSGDASDPEIWGLAPPYSDTETVYDANGYDVSISQDFHLNNGVLMNRGGGHFYTVSSWVDEVRAKIGRWFGLGPRKIIIDGNIKGTRETCVRHSAKNVELVINGNIESVDAIAVWVDTGCMLTINGTVSGKKPPQWSTSINEHYEEEDEDESLK